MNIWKRATITAAVLSGIFLAALLFTDISFRFSPSYIYYAPPSGESTAEFYPSSEPESDTAFLLAIGENTADKAILEGLLAINAPVMVCRVPQSDKQQQNILEAQASLLAAQTGLHESQLVIIGIHDGGTALLDEIIYGSHQYKALALIAPEITSAHIDEGTIVNGNYLNKSDWINSLSPEMIRQPTSLFSSSSDNITTSYNMTLLYNKLSGDEIIHVGGVYQATKGDLSLNILDGGFHPTSPYHPTILKGLFSFINGINPSLGLNYGLPASARGWVKNGFIISLFALVFCISQLTKYNLSEVSYGVSSSIRLLTPVRFFVAKGLSWVLTIPIAFLMLALFRQFFPDIYVSLPVIFSIILFSFSAISIVVTFLSRLTPTKIFRPVSFQAVRLLYGIGYAFIVILALLIIPFSGSTSILPESLNWGYILFSSVFSFPWFFFYIGEEEQIKDYKSGYATKIAYYLFCFLPLALFCLVYAVFQASTAAFACSIILALLVGCAFLGKGVFQLSGSTLLGGAVASFSLQTTMMLFAGFQT